MVYSTEEQPPTKMRVFFVSMCCNCNRSRRCEEQRDERGTVHHRHRVDVVFCVNCCWCLYYDWYTLSSILHINMFSNHTILLYHPYSIIDTSTAPNNYQPCLTKLESSPLLLNSRTAPVPPPLLSRSTCRPTFPRTRSG